MQTAQNFLAGVAIPAAILLMIIATACLVLTSVGETAGRLGTGVLGAGACIGLGLLFLGVMLT